MDFLGIEAIRVFAPDVYFAMANEKRTFAFPATDNIYKRAKPLPFPGVEGWIDVPAEDPSKRKDIFEKIIDKDSPESFSDTIAEIIRKLFPQVENLYSDEPHNNWEQELDHWTQQLRVCSGAVFDKYFSLSIVFSVLSEKNLNDFLTKIDDRPASAEKLKKFQKEDKLDLLLKRLLGSLDILDLSIQQLKNLLIVMFDFKENVIAEGPSDFDDLHYKVPQLGYKISGIIPKKKRIESLVRILNSTKDIGRSTWFINEMTLEAIRYEKSNEYERTTNFPNGILLTREEISSLNKICVEKIKKAAEDGSLENETGLGYLLSRWKEWESEKPVKQYVARLLETDDGLFPLLKAYYAGGKIYKESIEEFVDIRKVDERVKQFDVSNLEKEKAELIRLYLNSF